MMLNDFGLIATRKDTLMNGRAGGGWVEPTALDWICMAVDNNTNFLEASLEMDDDGNPVPPPVDPPVLSTRGFLPVTKAEARKLFQRVAGTRNQFKFVTKVGFLWTLHEIIKLAWPRLHADRINFEREKKSKESLSCFRRTATHLTTRGPHEPPYRPQYRCLDYDGAVAFALNDARTFREFADDEFTRSNYIIAVALVDWDPPEEDSTGVGEYGTAEALYEFCLTGGPQYYPMPLRKGTVLRLYEGTYNDEEETDAAVGLTSLGFDEEPYFAPLRKDPEQHAGVSMHGVHLLFGEDTATQQNEGDGSEGAARGIFPTNCVRIVRVDTRYGGGSTPGKAATKIQSTARGYVHRVRRCRQWDAAQKIQRIARGCLARVWWQRALRVQSNRAEYNVATLLDAVGPEERLATLLHRMGIDSFKGALKTVAKTSERGFSFALGNSTLPGAGRSHRTALQRPKWLVGGKFARNPQAPKVPRR
jgi:hypothetical protein